MIVRADEDALTQAILALAAEYGRYGYRRITEMLQRAGWSVGVDRVQRIWRREGLKVPLKQKPRGRLWLNDGSCIRLRPEHRNHVWSYDFVEAQTRDGRKLRLMTLIDEFSRECLAIVVARSLKADDVLQALADPQVKVVTLTVTEKAVDPNTGTVFLRAEVPNPDQELRTGMTGYTKIEGSSMPVWKAFTLAVQRFVTVQVWSWIP